MISLWHSSFVAYSDRIASGFQYYRLVAPVLYRLCGMGRSKSRDAGGRKESVALHHFLVDFVNTMSGGNTSCVQQANSYIKLRK